MTGLKHPAMLCGLVLIAMCMATSSANESNHDALSNTGTRLYKLTDSQRSRLGKSEQVSHTAEASNELSQALLDVENSFCQMKPNHPRCNNKRHSVHHHRREVEDEAEPQSVFDLPPQNIVPPMEHGLAGYLSDNMNDLTPDQQRALGISHNPGGCDFKGGDGGEGIPGTTDLLQQGADFDQEMMDHNADVDQFGEMGPTNDMLAQGMHVDYDRSDAPQGPPTQQEQEQEVAPVDPEHGSEADRCYETQEQEGEEGDETRGSNLRGKLRRCAKKMPSCKSATGQYSPEIQYRYLKCKRCHEKQIRDKNRARRYGRCNMRQACTNWSPYMPPPPPNNNNQEWDPPLPQAPPIPGQYFPHYRPPKCCACHRKPVLVVFHYPERCTYGACDWGHAFPRRIGKAPEF